MQAGGEHDFDDAFREEGDEAKEGFFPNRTKSYQN